MDVELRHLRSFLVVAEELNFTRAAEILLMTQPNLTRIINKLEARLGAQLLDRSTRHVALTTRGARLRTDLQDALALLDRALAGAARPESLRLGFTWLLPDDWSQHVIVRYERATGVRVDPIRREEMLAGVDRGDVDLAVVRSPREIPEGLSSLLLFRERRLAAVSRHNPVARRDSVGWNDFADWPLVVNTVSGATRPELWDPEHRPSVGMTCENFDEWLEGVAAGRGVGVIPETAAQRGLHSAIRLVEIEDAPMIDVVLVYPSEGAHELVHRFVEVAREAGGPPFGPIRLDEASSLSPDKSGVVGSARSDIPSV